MVDEHIKLLKNERDALDVLIQRLRAAYGEDISHVILYGSKERGDGKVDADLDILVLTKGDDPHKRGDILTMGARVSLEQDVLLNLLVMSEEKWKAHRGFTLYKNIIEDGLPLAQ